jgi:transposase
MYTIVQTAKLNGANPEADLSHTLAKITNGHPISRIGELLPWAEHSPERLK